MDTNGAITVDDGLSSFIINIIATKTLGRTWIFSFGSSHCSITNRTHVNPVMCRLSITDTTQNSWNGQLPRRHTESKEIKGRCGTAVGNAKFTLYHGTICGNGGIESRGVRSITLFDWIYCYCESFAQNTKYSDHYTSLAIVANR